jgi:arginine decarboxylase
MNKIAAIEVQAQADKGLNEFFSAAEARVDRWRALHRATRALAAGNAGTTDALRAQAAAVLEELAPLEELNGYPGPTLMAQLTEHLHAGDGAGLARLVQKISGALMSNSYRDDLSAWTHDEEGEASMADAILPPTLGRGQSRKPYFEILLVSAGERATWPALRETFRRLRRDDDNFVYEPVVVGTFEDAVLACLFNYNLQAVVAVDGFAFASQYSIPALREILSPFVPADAATRTSDMSGTLATVLRKLRPELDVFIVTDHDVAKLAGAESSSAIRRVFYGVEEPMEIHLAVLDGIKDRYETLTRRPSSTT